MDGWCDQAKKFRQEFDPNQVLNIVETEEEGEEWRGMMCCCPDVAVSHHTVPF